MRCALRGVQKRLEAELDAAAELLRSGAHVIDVGGESTRPGARRVPASEEMARALGRIYWDGEALASVPPTVATMSKQGAVNASRSEVVLVHAPHGDYVFCVITKNQQDQSWGHDNQGFVLLRDVSRILWQHFEPTAPYAAPAGADRFR